MGARVGANAEIAARAFALALQADGSWRQRPAPGGGRGGGPRAAAVVRHGGARAVRRRARRRPPAALERLGLPVRQGRQGEGCGPRADVCSWGGALAHVCARARVCACGGCVLCVRVCCVWSAASRVCSRACARVCVVSSPPPPNPVLQAAAAAAGAAAKRAAAVALRAGQGTTPQRPASSSPSLTPQRRKGAGVRLGTGHVTRGARQARC
jgi:hypothetical protein